MGRGNSLALVVAVAACACSSGSGSHAEIDAGSPDAGPGPTLVMTEGGSVQGAALASARVFYDIPYAAPPVGALRWKPPASAPSWKGTRDATSYGPQCPQYVLFTGASVVTTEDCLQLNVWTPLDATEKAPVMVFIHGGAYVSGSGIDRTYDGATLAAAGRAIVVTLNYRLGPFGFLAHPALAGDSPTPNLGLLDQQAALGWVERNIAAFGGDPGNVTLIGESAGAVSVCTHLVRAGSAGLFQRAIIESGACDGSLEYALADANAQGDALATALGCTDAATAASCLRGKSVAQVLGALPIKKVAIGATGVLWGPVLGTSDLPVTPLATLQSGHFARVPVVMGTNLHEGQLFTSVYEQFVATIQQADVSGILASLFGPAHVAAIATQYPPSTYPAPRDQVSTAMTDGIFACPTRRAARAIASHGGDAFLYQFVYPFKVTLVPGAIAAHGFELPFVFGNELYGTGLQDKDQPMATTMSGYWTSFAAAGRPTGPTTWAPYSQAVDGNLVLDDTVSTGSGLKKGTCDFWDGI
jgi:para-nitrobenzyl esterase